MAILEVSNISKKYNNNVILNSISFTINKGEVVGLIGKNGSGKSTLMKILVGLVKANSGYVNICEHNILKEREEALENTSVIIEFPSLYEDLTVKQHLKLNASLRNIESEKLNESCKYLDFGKEVDKKISKLSIGMKQEVGLAITFMNDTPLYILDEPINGLDFENVLKFRKKVQELKSDGKSFIISSHILKELEVIADRYLLLNNGKIMEIKITNGDNLEKIYEEKIYE